MTREEIEKKCDRINSIASVLPYAAHREIQELLCEIMELSSVNTEKTDSYKQGWHDAIDMALKETYTIHHYGDIFRVVQEETLIGLGMAYEQVNTERTEQFAKWVATEIFDEMWEYNKDAFGELACRKLAKLGIVRANGDEWELVEPMESEE